MSELIDQTEKVIFHNSADLMQEVWIKGDVHPRFRIGAGGKLEIGGGTLPADANLYRKSAGVIATDQTMDVNALRLNGVDVAGSGDYLNRILCRVSVPLNAVANTVLYTVPAGKTAKILEVLIEGQTAVSGGTSSKLLIGTSGNSFNELLNGTTGHTFISGTASSLPAVGALVDMHDLYPPATMSAAKVGSFAAASVIQANVSGTVVTTGAVWIHLIGYLI